MWFKGDLSVLHGWTQGWLTLWTKWETNQGSRHTGALTAQVYCISYEATWLYESLCPLRWQKEKKTDKDFVQFYYEWKARRKTIVEPRSSERCRQSDLSVLLRDSFSGTAQIARQPTKISDTPNPLNGPRAKQLRVLAYFLQGRHVNLFTITLRHECKSFLICND